MKVGRRVSVVCFLCASLLIGCAHMQVQQRKNELERLLNPLIGKSKEEVVMAIGIPTNTRYLGDLEVYQYFQSYGTRGNVWISPSEYVTTGGARTWESYDKINIYIKEGLMVKWDGYIQR